MFSLETVLQVKNLTKRFRNLVAVDNLELTVNRGDIFGFLGPNGAGKSTTIRMMLSLIYPDTGEVLLFGKPLKKNFKEVLKNVGAIVEKPDFYLYLSAFKNLEILAKLYGISPSKKQIMENLELVGLEKRYKSKVKTFSHGMKQRLGIAQALLHDPELIILDEPTSGLDPHGMKEVRDLITRLARDKGKTIFLSSHLLNEIELIANRMVIINKGKTVIEGNVSDLLDKSNADYVFALEDINKGIKVLTDLNYAAGIDFEVQRDEVIVKSKRIPVQELNKIFIQNNVDVLSFFPRRTLEEYFLSITQESTK
ncbi:MAG: ABC transporter ATP-binding protein [Bacteroidetes bacterium]|nr:ABC transporter ATP-binding protein [Bacteroidota bacterium]MBU2585820.1 ABC transporter ATP-binding protein [Bacteroidota bacterium]